MKKKLFNEIEIPEGIEVEINKNEVKIKGPEGTNQREFNINRLELKKEDNKIIVGKKIATKKEKRLMNSITAHIKNMIKGVQEKFDYELKICSSHFPMSVEINNNEITIKNFLGEKQPRKCKLPEDVEIKKEGDIIIISSIDKEKAGQAAAILEATTKIKNRDRRVFQDGIYIINKAGRKI